MRSPISRPSADVVPGKISISDSVLSAKDVLLKGVEHLERDLSPLHECGIDEIEYSEKPGTDRDTVKNIPGTQTEDTVYYHCDELSDDISSLSSRGSYEFHLMKYDPTQSTDKSGWVTVSGFAHVDGFRQTVAADAQWPEEFPIEDRPRRTAVVVIGGVRAR